MIQPRFTPSRDVRYMGLAWMMASFSKDPSTQVGALIVDPNTNLALGWGYNGPPAAFDDNKIDWSRPNKYNYIQHAEENAIDHCCGDLTGAWIYITAMPCKKCLLRLISRKFSKAIYTVPKVDNKSSVCEDKDLIYKMAKEGNLELVEFKESLAWISDWAMEMKIRGVLSTIMRDRIPPRIGNE